MAGEMAAPTPRSPPKYPDFSGRRRLQLELQTLSREHSFLQEELRSLEGVQPVSRCCREVNEFVGTNPDPLIPVVEKKRGSCPILKWIGSNLCCAFSWICCCCTGCYEQPQCCTCCACLKKLCCCSCKCDRLCCCQLPTCSCKEACCCGPLTCCCPCNLSRCCSGNGTGCCKGRRCCFLPSCSCPEYSCGCVLDCPKCTGVRFCCPNCSKPCCVSGCFC